MISSLMCAVGLAACCGLCCLKNQPQIKAAYYNSTIPNADNTFDSNQYQISNDLDSSSNQIRFVSFFDTVNNTNEVYDFNSADNQDAIYESYLNNHWADISVADQLNIDGYGYSPINVAGDYDGSDIMLMFQATYIESLNITSVSVSFGVSFGYLNNYTYGAFINFETYFANRDIYPTSITYDYHLNPYIYNLAASEINSEIYDRQVKRETFSAQNNFTQFSSFDSYRWFAYYGYGYVTNNDCPYLAGIPYTSYSAVNVPLPFSLVNYNQYFFDVGIPYYDLNNLHQYDNYFVWNNYSVRTTYAGNIISSLKGDVRYHVSVFGSNGNGSSGDNFDVAYNRGYDAGKKDGYQEGYVAGQSLSSNSWTRLFGVIADTPIKVLRSLFDFDLFGMNVLVVTLSLLTGIIVINVVRKFI